MKFKIGLSRLRKNDRIKNLSNNSIDKEIMKRIKDTRNNASIKKGQNAVKRNLL